MSNDAKLSLRIPRDCPWGLVGCLILMILCEAVIERRGFDWMTPDQWVFRMTGKRLTAHARDRDFLVFGDSLAKLSLAPKLVEDVSGLSGYNFALSGSQAANSYFLLNRVIKSGAKPRIILIDFFPPLLRLPHWHVIENDPFLLSTCEAIDYAWHVGDATFLSSLLARQALPSIRQRQSIRSAIVGRLDHSIAGTWAHFTHHLLHNITANNGAQIHVCEPLTHNLDLYDHSHFPHWQIQPVQEVYVDRFFTLARQHGIRVGLLLPPFCQGALERIARTGFEDRWMSWIRGKLNRHTNLFVIDGLQSEYEESAFFEPTHVGRDGATFFSKEVGKLLMGIDRPETTSRWHRIPKYQKPPRNEAIEDLADTSKVLSQLALAPHPRKKGTMNR
jgi:hypothetical protein